MFDQLCHRHILVRLKNTGDRLRVDLSWLILVPPWWVEDGVDEGFDVVG